MAVCFIYSMAKKYNPSFLEPQATDAVPWPEGAQYANYSTGHSACGAAPCVVASPYA